MENVIIEDILRRLKVLEVAVCGKKGLNGEKGDPGEKGDKGDKGEPGVCGC